MKYIYIKYPEHFIFFLFSHFFFSHNGVKHHSIYVNVRAYKIVSETKMSVSVYVWAVTMCRFRIHTYTQTYQSCIHKKKLLTTLQNTVFIFFALPVIKATLNVRLFPIIHNGIKYRMCSQRKCEKYQCQYLCENIHFYAFFLRAKDSTFPFFLSYTFYFLIFMTFLFVKVPYDSPSPPLSASTPNICAMSDCLIHLNVKFFSPCESRTLQSQIHVV